MSSFNSTGFETYYFNSTKNPDKKKIWEAFRTEWYNEMNGRQLWACSAEFIKDNFDANCKKRIKIRLQGKSFNPASIDDFYHYFDEWVSAQ